MSNNEENASLDETQYDIEKDGLYVLNILKFLQYQKAIFAAKEVVGVSESLIISPLDARKINGYFKIKASSALILHDGRMDSFKKLFSLCDSFCIFSYSGDVIILEMRVNCVFIKMS